MDILDIAGYGQVWIAKRITHLASSLFHLYRISEMASPQNRKLPQPQEGTFY